MVDIQPPTARIGEEKRRKIETTAAKYNDLPITMGGHAIKTKARFGRLVRPPVWKLSRPTLQLSGPTRGP